MLTIFCLIVFGKWPHELGLPIWSVALSLGLDLLVLWACSGHWMSWFKQRKRGMNDAEDGH